MISLLFYPRLNDHFPRYKEDQLSSKVTNIKFSEFINIKDGEFLKSLHGKVLVEDITTFRDNNESCMFQ